MVDEMAPARTYDNGVVFVFSNPIGMDDGSIRNGCSMILDPRVYCRMP